MDPALYFLKRNHGLTLVEVLIVVALLGVLAVLLLSVFNPTLQMQKGRDARRKADLKKIQNAFENYFNDAGCYPSSLPACGEPLQYTKIGYGTVTYLERVSCDPGMGSQSYGMSHRCTWYRLFTNLENTNDPDIDKVGCRSGDCIGRPGGAGEQTTYNYGVSSSNVRMTGPTPE